MPLPQDVIDEIFKHRPIYVVVMHKPDYEFSEFKIIGVKEFCVVQVK